MRIVDQGHGPPLVLVPGLQGRWEYLRPAVDALARSNRVLTFSLSDERFAQKVDPERALDDYVERIDAVLDDRGLARAVICGVSFGGLIALRFAARRPDRTTALILVSTPGPRWHLSRTHQRYVRLPWLFAPFFFAGAPSRVRPEIAAAIPDPGLRRQFRRGQLRTLLRAPLSPSKMAARARLIDGADNTDDCARIATPTLVVTGETALDHVVSADGSCEYVGLISGSRSATLERTGHLGCITRPDAFAGLVTTFLESAGVSSSASAQGGSPPAPGSGGPGARPQGSEASGPTTRTSQINAA